MAATIITALSTPLPAADAPYTFSYLASGDDSSSPGVYYPLSDSIRGPLYDLLARTPDWTVFNLGGTKCGWIHVRSRMANSTLANAALVVLQWTANAIQAAVQGPAGMGAIIFEIRLSQSERF
jgi:hypothetical protein